MKKEFILKDLNDTAKLAKNIAELAKPGVVLLLYGDLGAGKTTLTKFLAKELGELPENVSSPTFTIIHEYNSSPPIAHVDLYRLGQSASVFDLELYEYIDRGFFIIIEWAEYINEEDFDKKIKLWLKIFDNEIRKAILEY